MPSPLPSGPKTRLVDLGTTSRGPRNTPVVASYLSTWFVSRLETYRLPSLPNDSPDGPSSPPLPRVTKAPRGAPVVPSYRRTRLSWAEPAATCGFRNAEAV